MTRFTSLRAKRSNPVVCDRIALDCFVARASSQGRNRAAFGSWRLIVLILTGLNVVRVARDIQARLHSTPDRPMKPPFLKSLRLDGFLSFAPGSEAIELQGLNVLIGPNGSGKSNVIEAVELLKSLPVDFAAAVRAGGGAEGFLWKGGRNLD